MVSTLDQIFVLLKHWIVGLLPAVLQPLAGVLLSVVAIICVFPALFALDDCARAQGTGAHAESHRPQSRRPVRNSAAGGRRHQVADQGRHCSARARTRVVHFLAPLVLVVAVFMGFAVLPMGRNMVLVDMDAGLLFFFAMGASTELVGVHGGLVEPQQVFAAGRDARGGADDQLRGAAAAVERGRGDDDRLALAGQDCRGAEPVHVGTAALVHLHAVGTARRL